VRAIADFSPTIRVKNKKPRVGSVTKNSRNSICLMEFFKTIICSATFIGLNMGKIICPTKSRILEIPKAILFF